VDIRSVLDRHRSAQLEHAEPLQQRGRRRPVAIDQETVGATLEYHVGDDLALRRQQRAIAPVACGHPQHVLRQQPLKEAFRVRSVH
jgi:hypothetical protein